LLGGGGNERNVFSNGVLPGSRSHE
jgi:hypothetical protein